MEVRQNKMDTQSSNSNLDSSRNENTPAQLRRLRIQQKILQKGIKHLYTKLLEKDNSIGNNNRIIFSDDHVYFTHVKKMFIEIKNLFEEVRFLTAETKGKSTDIEEIRKNILLLETNIKEFKKYLQSELETLEKEELVLNEPEQQNQIGAKQRTLLSAMPIKLIASSPVKVLIETPFKCLEVQQFQEFMKRTKRHGGWNEYDHNKFIQIWNTYYSSVDVDSQEIDINSETSLEMIHELLNKIAGTNRGDIVSHIEWYIQYLQLYRCQKNALNTWKDNRNKIKKYNKSTHENEERFNSKGHYMKIKHSNKPQRSPSKCNNDSVFSKLSATGEESYGDLEDAENITVQTIKPPAYKSKLMEPTKQWLYRCKDQNDTKSIFCNIEALGKLQIPSWRVGLQN